MKYMTVWHNPTGYKWELVEQSRTEKSIKQIAAEYETLAIHHNVHIIDNTIWLDDHIKIEVTNHE